MFAIVRAVWRSQGVERTLMWIFAIVAFPIIGALFYFILANPSVRRTTRRRRAAQYAFRDSLGKGVSSQGEEPTDPLLSLAASATGYLPTFNNRVKLLADSDTAFLEIETALASAQKFIWVEYYIIKNDATGQKFLKILADKAKAGVEVRLLYDAVGSMGIDARLINAIRLAGGRVESFLPVNPLKRRWSVHLRNHRKLLIIDGDIGFTGGMNVGDEYSGRLLRRKKAESFKDTHLSLVGPALLDLCEIFAEDWYFASLEPLTIPKAFDDDEAGKAIVAVLPSGPDQAVNASAMLYFGGIATAKKSVYLTSPYFIPDEPTFKALMMVAMQGVDVRVMLPQKCDVMLVSHASRSYFPALLKAGVKIYLYQPSMLHAKTLAIDGEWSFVGSANFDIRSFRLNFELGALVKDADFCQTLEKRFFDDQALSSEVTLKSLAQTTTLQKIYERLARLMSPVL